MEKFYKVCDKIIKISSPVIYDRCPQWKKYETVPSTADLNYNFIETDSVPTYDEYVIDSGEDSNVGAVDNHIFRTFFSDGKPISTGVLNDDNNHTVFYSKEYADIATDNRRFWLNLSLHDAMLRFGIVNFHSSFIECNGEGLIFCGKSGAGKSTQAELWVKYKGARQINGDKSCVTVVNGKPTVYSIPICGLSHINYNESFPLKAILFPVKSNVNRLKRLTVSEIFSYAMPNIFYDSCNSEIMENVVNAISEIAKCTPFYALECTLSKEATEVFDL